MSRDWLDWDRSEYEPDEWDPEADQHDTTTGGLTIPSVDTDESDAPKTVVRTFWAVVIVVNVAVFFVALGPMLIFFLGEYRYGLVLIALGLVLFGFAYLRYRRFVSTTPKVPLDAIEAEDGTDSAADADGDRSLTDTEVDESDTDTEVDESDTDTEVDESATDTDADESIGDRSVARDGERV